MHSSIQSDFGVPCTEMHGKIAEYAAAVVRGKPAFHVSFMCDVSPHCDCHGMNDVPLVPDVGIAVSDDPVALDRACADLINAAPVLPGSALDGIDVKGDVFTSMHPATRWRDAIAEGERMKLWRLIAYICVGEGADATNSRGLSLQTVPANLGGGCLSQSSTRDSSICRNTPGANTRLSLR